MAHNTSLEAKTVRYAVAKMLSEDIFRFPRCWGILEQHWNGTLLRDLPTLLAWAKSMTWTGIHPMVQENKTIYQKGIALSKQAMREVERRLERNPERPKWDILIQPANR